LVVSESVTCEDIGGRVHHFELRCETFGLGLGVSGLVYCIWAGVEGASDLKFRAGACRFFSVFQTRNLDADEPGSWFRVWVSGCRVQGSGFIEG